MIVAKCIKKFRDEHNKIICYRIQDQQGNRREISAVDLKTAIANKQINIINLKLTSDGRLIDTAVNIQKQSKVTSALEKNIQDAILRGGHAGLYKSEVLYKLACQAGFGNIIELSDKASGACRELHTHFKNYKDALEHPEATIFITSMRDLFYGCEVQTLDLSSFNTSNVTNMMGMFSWCKAQTINLSNFNTSNVTTMAGMFHACQAQSIDLSKFNASNVKNMKYMFNGCQAKTLNLSSFNTSNVTNMEAMFDYCDSEIKTKKQETFRIIQQ